MNATLQPHKWTGPTGVHFVEIPEPDGTYYREGTPREVIDALQDARKRSLRVWFRLGDRETGRDWLDCYDVCGKVSRSMGPIKVPILLASDRSMGGGAILHDSIVRLMVDGRERYRHPGYHLPELEIREQSEPEYRFRVYADGKDSFGFKTRASAERKLAFIRGERMAP